MATIRSHVPADVGTHPEAPCIFCGGSTDIRAETPFRPDLGQVPLHLLCGAEIVELYRNRHRLLPEQQARVNRLVAG